MQTMKSLVKKIKQAVEDGRIPDFDAVAFSGNSGSAVGFHLAARLRKGVLLVRKDGETIHSCHTVEGATWAESYLIVDDLIDKGDTIRHIINITKKAGITASCVGIALYETTDLFPHFPLSDSESIPIVRI